MPDTGATGATGARIRTSKTTRNAKSQLMGDPLFSPAIFSHFLSLLHLHVYCFLTFFQVRLYYTEDHE